APALTNTAIALDAVLKHYNWPLAHRSESVVMTNGEILVNEGGKENRPFEKWLPAGFSLIRTDTPLPPIPVKLLRDLDFPARILMRDVMLAIQAGQQQPTSNGEKPQGRGQARRRAPAKKKELNSTKRRILEIVASRPLAGPAIKRILGLESYEYVRQLLA